MYQAKAIIFGIFIHSGMGITFFTLSTDGKCAKIHTNFLFRSFSLRWKRNQKIKPTVSAATQARTVGTAPARSTMASCVGTHRMRPHASSGLRAGQQPTGFGRKEISW